jgi:L-aspartate oxidase
VQNQFHKINCDLLIIGSGLAGLYAANYAAQFGNVVIVTKSKIRLSSSYLAQGGIASAVDSKDSPQIHLDDTIKAGKGLSNYAAVKVLVEEGKNLVTEMINNGAPFDMENDIPDLGMEGGHSKRRILHAGGDATGSVLVNYFVDIVKENSKIKILEDTIAYEILSDGTGCSGVLAYNWMDDRGYLITAKATILAAGGASGIYSRTTNPHTSTGDGIALAFEAGAVLAGMEFIQFHPTSFYSSNGRTFLISEAIRGEGAHLVNHKNERFIFKEHKEAELVTRDILSRSIFNELKQSGKQNVFLKLDHLDPHKIKQRFSHIYQEALKFNVDITKDLVPVAPAAHYMIGGVKTDIFARTNIYGLLACGEAASTGIHGANRLASNSLLECIVFAKRAVDLAKTLKHYDPVSVDYNSKVYRVDIAMEQEYCDIKNDLARVMMNYVGIERNEDSLTTAINEIRIISNKFETDKYEYYSSRLLSIINVCNLIAKSALMRKETRGVHFRTDFPNDENDMLGNFIHRKNYNTIFVNKENGK